MQKPTRSAHLTPARARRHLSFGLFLAMAACATAVARAANAPDPLWAHASDRARATRWFLPGRMEIDESVADAKGRPVNATHLEVRVERDAAGEPRAVLERSLENGKDQTRKAAAPVEAQITRALAEAFKDANPLLRDSADGVESAGERMIDGARCRGFTASAESDGLRFVFTIWIDAQGEYARRIEFVAVNVPLEKNGARLLGVEGATDYALDGQGRWFAVRQTNRTRFRASMLFFRFEGSSQTTTTYAVHWEYHGRRRPA